jgi:hypothetical protein
MRRIFVDRATVSPDPREMPTPTSTWTGPRGFAREEAGIALCHRTHAPSSLQNIRLNSDVANLLSRSQNWRADGDGCVLQRASDICQPRYRFTGPLTVAPDEQRLRRIAETAPLKPGSPLQRASDICQPRYRFTGPARNADPTPHMDRPPCLAREIWDPSRNL